MHSSLPNLDRILTEKEAAGIIGLSVRTLQQRRYLRQPPKYIRQCSHEIV